MNNSLIPRFTCVMMQVNRLPLSLQVAKCLVWLHSVSIILQTRGDSTYNFFHIQILNLFLLQLQIHLML